MKKFGNRCEFGPQRDRELHRRFVDILTTSRGLSVAQMYALAATSPASRFWVSEPRATAMVSAMLRCGDTEALAGCVPGRAAMYMEIFRRVRAALDAGDTRPLSHIVGEVVESPAPEFYLTPKSAKVIICAYMRRRRALASLNALRVSHANTPGHGKEAAHV